MTEFHPTHVRRPVPGRRGSPVEAQLLAEVDDTALYKVRFKAGREEVVRFTSASAAYFSTAFEPAK